MKKDPDANPRDVRCPACDAAPGAPCWADTHKDRTIDEHHRDRVLAIAKERLDAGDMANIWSGPEHLSFAGQQTVERAIHVAREAALGALHAMFDASPELHPFEIQTEITYELRFKPRDSASPAASSREEQE